SPVQRTGGRRYYRMADMLLLGGIKFLLHEQGMTIKAVQNLFKEQGVAHVQSFSPAIEGETQQKEPTPEVSHAETSVPEENVVDLQFDPAKLSQSVLLSEGLERGDDGTQLLLFPELASEVPLADPKITSIHPVPGIALGTDLPPQDPDLNSFPPTASLMTRVLQIPADTLRAALRSSPEVVTKLRALQAKMSV
ncbi:MAG: MerR family transcriptional regulator, partial [Planktomarina sp.]|nr:MerR family transcriptional regulator [Planktomarina sp.]